MMCFFVVCLLVFSIGSLQPLEVNADDDPMPTEESPLKEMTTAPPLPPRRETLGNPPSPVSNRENDEIPTPKPSLPYWKPVGSGSSPRKPTPPSSQNPVPVPQSPEQPTPKPPGSTLPGRKPGGPLPPPPPPPPEDPQTQKIPTPKPSKPKPPLSAENEVTDTQKPSSNFKKPWNKLFPTRKPSLSSENGIDQTHKPSPPFWKPLTNLFPTRKPTGPLSPTPPSVPQTPKIPTPKPSNPKPPLSAENEVTDTHKPTSNFKKPWNKLFPTRKPSVSSENEIDQTHKPSPPFWKPLTDLFPTRKPTGPLSPTPPPVPQTPKIPTPKPPFSAENEVAETQKPSPPFWKPLTDIFPTRKPKGPTLPPSKSDELGFPTPKPLFPPKGPRHTESNPTGSPNNNNQVCVEEWTTKKSYLQMVCPCCF